MQCVSSSTKIGQRQQDILRTEVSQNSAITTKQTKKTLEHPNRMILKVENWCASSLVDFVIGYILSYDSDTLKKTWLSAANQISAAQNIKSQWPTVTEIYIFVHLVKMNV